jgi:hypothetical protein
MQEFFAPETGLYSCIRVANMRMPPCIQAPEPQKSGLAPAYRNEAA